MRVILQLRSQSDQASMAQEVTGAGGRVLRTYRHFPLIALEVNRNALPGLQRSPLVISMMEDIPERPILDSSLPLINADDVHALGWTGAGFAVVILDTGIDRNHPFVSGRVVEEACYSSTGDDLTPLCPNGTTSQTGVGAAGINSGACVYSSSVNLCYHGMHVAGIAAGNGTGISGAPKAGVAPAASIIAMQVFTRIDNPVKCDFVAACIASYPADQIAALDHVLDLAPSYSIAAVNMSLGIGLHQSACDDDDRKVPIDALMAVNIATAIASGNDGSNHSISKPACISTAVAVGAVDDFDYAVYNRGRLLDLLAPGKDIISSLPNGAFGSLDGSSMAAPHLAGAWAVLRQAVPSMSVSDLLLLFQTTGKPISYVSATGSATTSRIDLLAALRATTDPPVVTATNATVAVNEGSAASNTGTFSDPNGDPVTLKASIGTVTGSGATWSWSFGTKDGPAQSQTVTITGTDNRGAEGTATFALTVDNVAPTVNAGADATATSNTTFNFSGNFGDPGVVDHPWSWTIDWGDGATSSGTTHSQATAITDSHQYCAVQSYTVRLTVTDKDGGSGFDELSVAVGYAVVTIDITPDGNPNSVNLSNTGLLPVALLSSATFDATKADPASVTLGDGSGTDTHVAKRPNGRYYAAIEDVNGDGINDVVFSFSVADLVANSDLTAASTVLYLRGVLTNGCGNFQGSDSIRPVP